MDTSTVPIARIDTVHASAPTVPRDTISFAFRRMRGKAPQALPRYARSRYHYTGLLDTNQIRQRAFWNDLQPAWAISLPTVTLEAKMRGQAALADNYGIAWYSGRYADAFRELDEITEGYSHLPFEAIDAILETFARRSEERVQAVLPNDSPVRDCRVGNSGTLSDSGLLSAAPCSHWTSATGSGAPAHCCLDWHVHKHLGEGGEWLVSSWLPSRSSRVPVVQGSSRRNFGNFGMDARRVHREWRPWRAFVALYHERNLETWV